MKSFLNKAEEAPNPGTGLSNYLRLVIKILALQCIVSKDVQNVSNSNHFRFKMHFTEWNRMRICFELETLAKGGNRPFYSENNRISPEMRHFETEEVERFKS